ncbi:hypothetical protein KC730_02780 [Candidatus Kaiserbacteria bacterium]|nr:hypothetical protein [Candidatus Kaiserbacteria bacterium]
MFRTRDFVLLFVTIVFLVMAIGATFINSYRNPNSEETPLKFVESQDVEYSAETYSPKPLSRDANLAEMRSKIAASDLTIAAPAKEEEVVPEEVMEEEVEQETKFIAQKCSNYNPFLGTWNSSDLKSEVTNTSRIFYRELAVVPKPVIGTTSTEQIPSEPSRDIVVQLPLFPLFKTNVSCLPSDVVGIAQDGSLIRNSESGLYGVFGSETLVGYALDGYPIYGSSSEKLDECGGSSSTGSYAYYVTPQAEHILNCFRANPLSL